APGQRDLGSPPRTWGRRHGVLHVAVQPRFTPTHVGKTTSYRRAGSGRTVHPHARGEDPSLTATALIAFGSPPRTWGRQERGLPEPDWIRFTPTHVGKTRTGT